VLIPENTDEAVSFFIIVLEVSNETLWAALRFLIMLCKLAHLHIHEYS
jgi:hypothetical protein